MTNDFEKTYIHHCSFCEKVFATDKKMEKCTKCNNSFNRIYEQFIYLSDELYLYLFLCEDCKIIFNSEIKKQKYPRCEKIAKKIGFEIREAPEPTTFKEKLSHFISEFLP